MPLNLIMVIELFALWGQDFIVMINPISSVRHKWILMATNYFTRWTKVVPLKNATEMGITNFLEELVTKSDPPKTIISNNARAFLGSKIRQFTLDHKIFLKNSSNYYPRGNDPTKSTNKNLIKLIERIGSECKSEWHNHLKEALWVDIITPNKILNYLPYELVYSKEV